MFFMEQKLLYYLYLLFIANFISHILTLYKLSGMLIIAQSIVLAIIIIGLVYFSYSFETKKEKPYMETMVFFALITLNSIIVYFLAKKIDSIFIGLLNVAGVYLVTMMIPSSDDIGNTAGVKTAKKNVNKKEWVEGIEPLKPLKLAKSYNSDMEIPTPPSRKPNYFIEELEREIAKEEAKKKNAFFEEDDLSKKKDLSKEDSIFDDPDVIDESDIVIEEIKPTIEKDLHPVHHKKKAKKHIGKKILNEILKENEEFDKNDPIEKEDIVIEEITPLKDIKLPPLRKSARKPIKKQGRKKTKR